MSRILSNLCPFRTDSSDLTGKFPRTTVVSCAMMGTAPCVSYTAKSAANFHQNLGEIPPEIWLAANSNQNEEILL